MLIRTVPDRSPSRVAPPAGKRGPKEISAPSATPQPSAAEAFLGSALESIRADVEQLWRKNREPHWRDRHAKAASLTHRLSTLDQAVPNLAADVDTLWDKARVLLDLHGDEAAKPLLHQILEQRPTHTVANFHLGRLLLDIGCEEGEAHLERAMAEDEEITPQACELLHHHYRRNGCTDRLRELAACLNRYEKDVIASRAERSTVKSSDPLDEAELAALREVLAAEPELVSAKLARKDLRHFPKQKLFLLCVHRRPAWHRLPNRDREQTLVNRLSQTVRLPGRVLVFTPSGSFRALARKVSQVEDAMVFGR